MKQHFYEVCGALWNGFLRLCSTFAWPIGIGGGIAVGALLIVMYYSGAFAPSKSPEVKVAEDEIECVAAAALADSKREPGANLEEVRENIAKATRQYAIVNKTPVCEVFEKGLTMIPVGQKRPKWYQGRRIWYVKMEFSGTAWDTATVMAKKVLKLPPASLGCATHLVRAPRAFEESKETLDRIRAMKKVPKDPKDPSKIEFFCPA